ncbi:MAG: RluA family pseudouridine synthase [Candidatus Uhrbacteria bacterium]
MIQHFAVTETEENFRLDVFLAEKLETPRSQAQKLIKGGKVKVNEAVVEKSSLKIVLDDNIEVISPDLQPTTYNLQPPKLDVLFEDSDVLVINKPAGLLVHRVGPDDTTPTLVDALLAHDQQIAKVGDDPEERPGIVHRLDKMASGILVVAKNQPAFEYLKNQFATRTAKKEYLALVYGQFKQPCGQINFRIGRSTRTGKMVAKPEGSEEGKEAVTEFDVIEQFATTALLQVRIKTGRTHQIRAHLQAFNHPIVGDLLYRNKKMTNIRPIKLDRLFLHAAKLTITLPNGETKTFEATLPEELENLLKELN